MRLDQDPLPPPDPIRKSWVQQEILDLLKTAPAKSADLIDRLNATPGSVKNAITVLRRQGLVVVQRLEDKSRVYALAQVQT